MSLPNAPFYRRWSFILAGVIGLAAITALLGWRGLQQVDPPASTGTTQSPTTVTSPTTTTPPSSIEPSNFKRLGGGNFKITGTGAFARVDIQELDVKASGTRTFTRGGYGHLLVDSVCTRWSVTVLPG
jgi:hypothetical protein